MVGGKCPRGSERKKRKRIYIAPLLKYLTLKTLRYGSHSVTCKLHHSCLYLVSIHQMAHPRLRLRTSNCSLLLIYLPRKDERLSWPEITTEIAFWLPGATPRPDSEYAECKKSPLKADKHVLRTGKACLTKSIS